MECDVQLDHQAELADAKLAVLLAVQREGPGATLQTRASRQRDRLHHLLQVNPVGHPPLGVATRGVTVPTGDRRAGHWHDLLCKCPHRFHSPCRGRARRDQQRGSPQLDPKAILRIGIRQDQLAQPDRPELVERLAGRRTLYSHLVAVRNKLQVGRSLLGCGSHGARGRDAHDVLQFCSVRRSLNTERRLQWNYLDIRY